jgi:hypothetical protein
MPDNMMVVSFTIYRKSKGQNRAILFPVQIPVQKNEKLEVPAGVVKGVIFAP